MTALKYPCYAAFYEYLTTVCMSLRCLCLQLMTMKPTSPTQLFQEHFMKYCKWSIEGPIGMRQHFKLLQVTTQTDTVPWRIYASIGLCVNTLRPRQNGRHFADDMFKCIFLNENVWIPIEISLTFVPKGPINNIPALVQIMAWCRPGKSHYLKQWWLIYRRIYASLGLSELICVSNSAGLSFRRRHHGQHK